MLENSSPISIQHDAFTDVVMPVGFNSGVAIGDFVSSIQLLQNQESYHPKQDQFRASLLILSASQLFLATYAPFLIKTLGSTTGITNGAFAIKSLLDSINYSIELHNALKKQTFTGWLEESLLELNRYECLLERNRKKAKEIDSFFGDLRVPYIKKYWEKEKAKLETKIKELEKKTENLLEDIEARSMVYITNRNNADPKNSGDCPGESVSENAGINASPYEVIHNIIDKVGGSLKVKSMLNHDYDVDTQKQRERDKAIQLECKKVVKEKTINLSLSILNCIGSSLLVGALFYPPLFIPGIIIVAAVGIASAYLGIKQMMETATQGPKLSQHSNSFFALNVKENPKDMRYYQSALAARM